MLLQLKTERVTGYTEGQEPLIYLVSTVQAVQQNGVEFVFSDGHGIAAFTNWYMNVIGQMILMLIWTRQRRKQAEFLIYRDCHWSLIYEIVVMNKGMKEKVKGRLAAFPRNMHRAVQIKRNWYY